MEKLFKQIMSFKAMTAVLKENEILYYTEYDYSKFYKKFFEYMFNTGYKEYKSTDFLRKKIDYFGELFIEDYKKNIDASDNKKNQKIIYFSKIQDVKNKFVGNLFEMICVLYFTNCNLPEYLSGLKFKSWDNGNDYDMLGVDGILTDDSEKLEIPINAKHSLNITINKDLPHHKLKSFHDTKISVLINNENWDLVKKYNDMIHGIIITDIDVGKNQLSREMKTKKFPDIYIINCEELWKKMGCTGEKGTITKRNVWEQGYKLTK